ncbi:MAG: hypothetical protein IJK23_13260 [Clostridia bacterium]|nr:hypothetical protein [Clostridia bacterium]
MTTKKIISVLIAVLMALSCCVSAFAGNWVNVATSPDGLPDGSYYLDLPYAKKADGTEDQTIAAAINSCTYRLDLDNLQMEVTSMEGTVTGGDAQSYLIWLQKTGVNWLPVATSDNGLQDGDYYLDVDGCVDDLVAVQKNLWVAGGNNINSFDEETFRTESKTGLENLVILINPDDPLFEICLKNYFPYPRVYMEDGQEVTFTVYNDINFPIAVNGEPELSVMYNTLKANIHQYTAPSQPEEPTEPEEPAQQPNFWKRIVSFFLSIINFFKQLFK